MKIQLNNIKCTKKKLKLPNKILGIRHNIHYSLKMS